MRPAHFVFWFTTLALVSRAFAQDEVSHRVEQDAGVYQPVLTKAPTLAKFVEPVYPPDALAAGKTADVTLVITLNADGTVADAKVPNPVGDGFDEAAIDAVKQFVFTPGEIDGKPAAIQIGYVYHFVLKPPAPPPPAPLSPSTNNAQAPPKPNAMLKGTLYGRGRRVRVPGATVRCGDDPEAREALSDAKGRFELPATSGDCLVRVVANGFELFKTKEALRPNETVEVNYYLTPHPGAYETVVKGDRESKEVVKRTLTRDELQKIPGSFGDPLRIIQDLPGVARTPYGFGQLIVRGASPDETLTLLDGVEIPILFHLGGGPSVVNAQFLDRIDFYPGGFGARYGRAIGGIVDVYTRKGAADGFHGEAKVDVLDADVFAEVPITDSISVAAAARRSYVDALLPLVLPKDPNGGTLLVVPQYWDYQVRADFGNPRKVKPGDAVNTFYVMAFGSNDYAKVVATGGGRNTNFSLSIQTLFHRVKGDWTYSKGILSSVFTPYLGYDLANGDFGVLTFKADRWSAGGREDLELKPLKWLTLRAGVDTKFDHLVGSSQLPVLKGTQYVGFPGASPTTQTQTLSVYPNSFDGAVYLETDFKVGKFTFTPGLRASYQRVYGHDLDAFDPRLWVKYQLFKNTELKGSVGLYSQAPASTDLLMPPLGSPFLKDEHAFQTSVGVLQRINSSLTVDVTGYYNRRYGLVAQPGPTVINEDGSVTNYRYSNGGLGKAYGLEVLIRQEVTAKLFGWVAYTLNKSIEKDPGDPGYSLTSYDETHILTVLGSYKLPLGFEVGARFRYVTGRPYTPIDHPYDQFNVDSGNFSGVSAATGSARYTAFNQLDVRVEKDWLFKTWTLGVYLDVQNVYNATNQEALLYDYRYRTTYAVPGIPFLPDLGVRANW